MDTLKGKESRADLKPPGEEQSRKRLIQWVSHGVRRKWSLSAELVGGREWRPHAPDGAKSKKKKDYSLRDLNFQAFRVRWIKNWTIRHINSSLLRVDMTFISYLPYVRLEPTLEFVD